MSAPLIQIKQGKLKGKIGSDYNEKEYYSFQGIPYGKPPVGELRFKAPKPAEPWTGILDATAEGSESISKHMLFQHDIGSENCLYLNVYTPELPNGGSLKPVMVWIHGGGFTAGSSKTEIYGPEFLITEDVVLVSINYRLGILGFLSLEDTSLGVPGNAGLKDMVLALKWVQDNIKHFNGDSNNVTIFGESAGAASCHYLMVSPSAKGLFHRAILQSGVSLNPWASGSRNVLEIAKVLGRNTSNEKEALEFLRSVPEMEFLKAQSLIKDGAYVYETRPFGPVIEKPNPEAFLTTHPMEIMLSGNYNKVPVMIGYNSREGMFVQLFQTMVEKIETNFRPYDFQKAIPNYYKIKKNSDLSKSIARQIEKFYYGNEATPENELDLFYIMNSDIFFVRGIHVTVRSLLKTLDQPIYLYRLNLETVLNIYKAFGHITAPGVSHADDLGYLFKTVVTPELKRGSVEDIAVRRMVKLWTSFAKTGNPNPKVQGSLLNVQWPPVTADKYCCLDIDKELSIALNPEHERMKFWDDISKMKGIYSKL